MAIFQLPTRNDLPAYDFQIELDGVLFTLGISFNSRANFWVLDIFDANELPLLCGIRIISGWLLTQRFSIEGLPKGNFFVFDTTGNDDDPSMNNFSVTKLLMYADAQESLNV